MEEKTEIRPATFKSLAEFIVNAGPLQTSTELHGDKPADVLLDSRLDEFISKQLKDYFDCIILSQIPLSRDADDLRAEDNASRCWFFGGTEYDAESIPKSSDVESFLTGWVDFLRSLHSKRRSLFLHPYFFRQAEIRSESLKLCFQRMRGIPTPPPFFDIPVPRPSSGLVEINPRFGYHHTGSIEFYGQADIVQLWADVDNRRGSKTEEQDARECLNETLQMSHDYIGSWLAQMDPEGRARERVTAIYVAPTSVLATSSVGTDRIPTGIVGMCWLTVATRGNSWRDAERRKADELLRTAWLLFISEHMRLRQEADRVRGALERDSADAHELKYIYSAISRRTAPEVLDVIESYFRYITDVPAPPTAGEPLEPRKRVLAEMFRETSALALRIQCMVELARSGRTEMLQNSNVFIAAVGEIEKWFHERLRTSFDEFNDEYIWLATGPQSGFRLAVLACFRNAIHHVRNSDPTSGSFSISVDEKEAVLRICNTLCVQHKTSVSRGKPSGTLGSLRTYVRAYGGNPQSVDVFRTDWQSVSATDGPAFESWEHKLPLPNHSK